MYKAQNRQFRREYYYRPGRQALTTVPAARSLRPLQKLVAVIGVVVVVASVGFITKLLSHIEASPNVLAQSFTSQPEETPVPAFVPDESALNAKMSQIIAAYPNMQISVSVVDTANNKSYQYGTAEPYLAASTAKVLTATYFLDRVGIGVYTLDTPVAGVPAREQLRKMIELSDNGAWAAFNQLLGKDNLKAYALSIGMKEYDPFTNMMLSDDIALVNAKMFKGELINEANRNLLLEHMKKANRAEFIPAAVPANLTVYHKAGWLDDRVHDVGIIDDGNGHSFVIAIYTKVNGAFNAAAGQAMARSLTAAGIATFIPAPPVTP